MLLLIRLRTRAELVCQRLLTVEKRARGGVLERSERLVDLERLSDVFRTLHSDVVNTT